MPETAFAGRTALVTGGARGIGRATAIRLAREGARVAVNFVANAAAAEQTLAEIRAAGGDAIAVQADVANREDVARMVKTVRSSLGPIELLAHCAGISIVEPASAVTWETWRKTMDVNLDGTFHVVYAVKDDMLERNWGRMVLLSSIAGLRERENQVHYSASKAAVIGMARSLAQAWARHNIRINVVCPGLIETDMADTLSPQTQANIIANTPMGRIGRPEEIANLVRFLLSDESSFMTGQSVVASGGRVMLPG